MKMKNMLEINHEKNIASFIKSINWSWSVFGIFPAQQQIDENARTDLQIKPRTDFIKAICFWNINLGPKHQNIDQGYAKKDFVPEWNEWSQFGNWGQTTNLTPRDPACYLSNCAPLLLQQTNETIKQTIKQASIQAKNHLNQPFDILHDFYLTILQFKDAVDGET